MNKKLYLLILLVSMGCVNEGRDRCLTNIDYYRYLNFKIIINDKQISGKTVTFTGRDPDTNSKSTYSAQAGYLYNNYTLYDVGDTIIKHKDAFYIKVKKKNKMYLINLSCEGYFFVDSIIYNH